MLAAQLLRVATPVYSCLSQMSAQHVCHPSAPETLLFYGCVGDSEGLSQLQGNEEDGWHQAPVRRASKVLRRQGSLQGPPQAPPAVAGTDGVGKYRPGDVHQMQAALQAADHAQPQQAPTRACSLPTLSSSVFTDRQAKKWDVHDAGQVQAPPAKAPSTAARAAGVVPAARPSAPVPAPPSAFVSYREDSEGAVHIDSSQETLDGG